jgi:uncharacterized protein (TIGR03066 family)
MSLTLVLLSSLSLLPAADEPSTGRDKLVGRWVCSQLPGLPKDMKATMRLTFTADDKVAIVLDMPGISKLVSGRYKLVGDKLTITDLSEALGNRTTHEQTIQLKGDELILKDTDGTSAVFKKG